jgi:hypothetical protein
VWGERGVGAAEQHDLAASGRREQCSANEGGGRDRGDLALGAAARTVWAKIGVGRTPSGAIRSPSHGSGHPVKHGVRADDRGHPSGHPSKIGAGAAGPLHCTDYVVCRGAEFCAAALKAGLEGGRVEASRRAVRAGAHRDVAEDQGAPRAGVRRRLLHGSRRVRASDSRQRCVVGFYDGARLIFAVPVRRSAPRARLDA